MRRECSCQMLASSCLPQTPIHPRPSPSHIIFITLDQAWGWRWGGGALASLSPGAEKSITHLTYILKYLTCITPPRSHFCVSDLIICRSLSLSFLIKNCYKSFCHRRYKMQVCWRNCLAELFWRWLGALLWFIFFNSPTAQAEFPRR